ncbi:MAG: orotidine 5'-phosphate decarboxylase / HUMPS family protein, partial [Longimicrobiaceae bacterium]
RCGDAGCDGVVCPVGEVAEIRGATNGRLLTLCPGIRPEGAPHHDQLRGATPAQAREQGADYVVLGRAVTEASDPAAAYLELSEQLRTPMEVAR